MAGISPFGTTHWWPLEEKLQHTDRNTGVTPSKKLTLVFPKRKNSNRTDKNTGKNSKNKLALVFPKSTLEKT